MTNLKRIKSYSKLQPVPNCCALCPGHEVKFLLKAFEVMKQMCIEYADQSWHRGDEEEINKEFEEKMVDRLKTEL